MVYDILQAQSNMAEVEQAVRKCGSVIFCRRVLRSAGDGRCRNGHWALHVLLALELYQWDVLAAKASYSPTWCAVPCPSRRARG
jgi:hypothetical protein